jgi:hypothetical protein
VVLDDTSIYQRSRYDGEFTAADLRQHMAQWQPVLAWAEQMSVVVDRGLGRAAPALAEEGRL